MPKFPRTDVLGNKSDDESGSSLYSKGYINDKHNHSVSLVYPTLAAGVQITAVNGATTWTLSDSVEIIPVNTITAPFDIHDIFIEEASADTTYEISLYVGPSDTLIGTIRCTRDSVGGLKLTSNSRIVTPLLAANQWVSARVATPDDNGETITIALLYHTY